MLPVGFTRENCQAADYSFPGNRATSRRGAGSRSIDFRSDSAIGGGRSGLSQHSLGLLRIQEHGWIKLRQSRCVHLALPGNTSIDRPMFYRKLVAFLTEDDGMFADSNHISISKDSHSDAATVQVRTVKTPTVFQNILAIFPVNASVMPGYCRVVNLKEVVRLPPDRNHASRKNNLSDGLFSKFKIQPCHCLFSKTEVCERHSGAMAARPIEPADR